MNLKNLLILVFIASTATKRYLADTTLELDFTDTNLDKSKFTVTEITDTVLEKCIAQSLENTNSSEFLTDFKQELAQKKDDEDTFSLFLSAELYNKAIYSIIFDSTKYVKGNRLVLADFKKSLLKMKVDEFRKAVDDELSLLELTNIEASLKTISIVTATERFLNLKDFSEPEAFFFEVIQRFVEKNDPFELYSQIIPASENLFDQDKEIVHIMFNPEGISDFTLKPENQQLNRANFFKAVKLMEANKLSNDNLEDYKNAFRDSRNFHAYKIASKLLFENFTEFYDDLDSENERLYINLNSKIKKFREELLVENIVESIKSELKSQSILEIDERHQYMLSDIKRYSEELASGVNLTKVINNILNNIKTFKSSSDLLSMDFYYSNIKDTLVSQNILIINNLGNISPKRFEINYNDFLDHLNRIIQIIGDQDFKYFKSIYDSLDYKKISHLFLELLRFKETEYLRVFADYTTLDSDLIEKYLKSTYTEKYTAEVVNKEKEYVKTKYETFLESKTIDSNVKIELIDNLTKHFELLVDNEFKPPVDLHDDLTEVINTADDKNFDFVKLINERCTDSDKNFIRFTFKGEYAVKNGSNKIEISVFEELLEKYEQSRNKFVDDFKTNLNRVASSDEDKLTVLKDKLKYDSLLILKNYLYIGDQFLDNSDLLKRLEDYLVTKEQFNFDLQSTDLVNDKHFMKQLDEAISTVKPKDLMMINAVYLQTAETRPFDYEYEITKNTSSNTFAVLMIVVSVIVLLSAGIFVFVRKQKESRENALLDN